MVDSRCAKRRIFMNQGADQVAVLERGDPGERGIAATAIAVVLARRPAGRVLEEKIRAETREFQGRQRSSR